MPAVRRGGDERAAGRPWSSQVPAEARRALAATAFFCPTPNCPVAYFDAFEAQVAAAVACCRPVYPKDPAAPLCPCFGLTRDDVEADVAEGMPRRIRELLAKSKSPAAHCETASPTGPLLPAGSAAGLFQAAGRVGWQRFAFGPAGG